MSEVVVGTDCRCSEERLNQDSFSELQPPRIDPLQLLGCQAHALPTELNFHFTPKDPYPCFFFRIGPDKHAWSSKMRHDSWVRAGRHAQQIRKVFGTNHEGRKGTGGIVVFRFIVYWVCGIPTKELWSFKTKAYLLLQLPSYYNQYKWSETELTLKKQRKSGGYTTWFSYCLCPSLFSICRDCSK